MTDEHAARAHTPTPASTSRRTVLLGALGVVAGCGGGGGGGNNETGGAPYGGGSPTPTAGGSPTATTEAGASPAAIQPPITVRGKKANYHGQKSVAGTSSVTVDMYDFYFEPTVLVGSPGQKLTVNLLNEGQMPHTFTIESQNVDVVLQPGQKGRAEVVFPESGQQGFVCRYHIAQGMLGLLATQS